MTFWLINFFLSWAFSVAHRDALIVYNTIYYTALESQIWNFLVIFTIIMGSGGYVSHSVLPVGSFHHFITLSIVLQTDRQTFLQNHSELALLKSKGSMLQRVLMWPRSSLSTCGVEYSHYEYSRGVCHVYTSLLLYEPCYRWDADHLIWAQLFSMILHNQLKWPRGTPTLPYSHG